MASAAGGIAKVFGDLASRTYRFSATEANFSAVGEVDLAGTWSLTETNGNTIVWNGDDPSMTLGEIGRDADAVRLGVNIEATSTVGRRMVTINHSAVTLSPGDTIIYTSVQVSFNTAD